MENDKSKIADRYIRLIEKFSAEDRKKAIDASIIFLEGGLAMLRVAKQSQQN